MDQLRVACDVSGLAEVSTIDDRHRVLYGPLSLDLATRTASVAGRPLGLSPGEFALVHLLVIRRDMPLSKPAIMAELHWSGLRLDARMVDVFVARARVKLEAAGWPDLIQTIAGRGYAISGLPPCEMGARPKTGRGLDRAYAAA